TTGMTVDEYMSHYVFTPAGFAAGYHTPNLPYGSVIARIYDTESYGVTLDLNGSEETHYYAEPELDYTHTAGALCITAKGLARLCIALCGDGTVDGVRILEEETVRQMRTMQNNIGSVSCESGRGLNLNILTDVVADGRTVYGHQGKAYGMLCAAYFDPTDRTGIVLLTNGCDDSTFNSVGRIVRAVMRKAWTYMD
ncbi:MAG: serine hydrolase, partial [Clostridiales bacterium]|nr:serine hydrolase [Clostridiales bacterium]